MWQLSRKQKFVWSVSTWNRAMNSISFLIEKGILIVN